MLKRIRKRIGLWALREEIERIKRIRDQANMDEAGAFWAGEARRAREQADNSNRALKIMEGRA